MTLETRKYAEAIVAALRQKGHQNQAEDLAIYIGHILRGEDPDDESTWDRS